VTVNDTIDVLVTVITVTFAVTTVRSFEPLRHGGQDLFSDVVLAIRCGMVMLLASCLFGYWMLWYRGHPAASNQSPRICGEAGVVKFRARYAHARRAGTPAYLLGTRAYFDS
jgi:hypothetical protein